MGAILSQRTYAIAEGLVRTGRALEPKEAQGYLQLRAKHGSGFYWIAPDGLRLLRGDDFYDAEELQPTFTQSMIRAARLV